MVYVQLRSVCHLVEEILEHGDVDLSDEIVDVDPG